MPTDLLHCIDIAEPVEMIYSALTTKAAIFENSPRPWRWVFLRHKFKSPVKDEKNLLPSLAGLFDSPHFYPALKGWAVFRVRDL